VSTREFDDALSLPDLVWVSLYTGVGALLRIADVAVLVLSPRLLRACLRMWRARVEVSPYKMHTFEKVRDARRRGVSIRELVYGETPVWTARRVFRAAGVARDSKVLDLGAGRGRALLGARSLGATARGVDVLDSHVDAANAALVGTGVRVDCEDAARADLEGVTHVYLTWTCLSATTRRQVVEHLRACPTGTTVITLSEPIDDVDFVVERSVAGLFTWGSERAFIHSRRADEAAGT
jgi:SAM-dependent methyltransferase